MNKIDLCQCKHINIPIFIPHLGCPNDCVFCNQRKISGKCGPNISEADREIESFLEAVGDKYINGENADIQIAFFGGSFTGIDRNDMMSLLSTAYKYIKAGKVSSVRLSTRPDYINDEILSILSNYGVRDIELGIQSMDDAVLTASNRGHNSETSVNACKLIKSRGFNLVGQMMIGLPMSDIKSELLTAETLCDLGVDGARIYPTVVLKDTRLAQMTKSGDYIPLGYNDAIIRCAEVLKVFVSRNVDVIRIGLCAQDNLRPDKDIAYGSYNESIGEYAHSVLYKDILEAKLNIYNPEELIGKRLIAEVPVGAVSKVIGNKCFVKNSIMEKYGLKSLKAVEKSDISEYNVDIVIY